MISKTIDIVRRNLVYYVLYVIASLGFAYLNSGLGFSAPVLLSSIFTLVLAYYVHRAVLLDLDFGQRRPKGRRRTSPVDFIFKGLVLGILALLTSIVAVSVVGLVGHFVLPTGHSFKFGGGYGAIALGFALLSFFGVVAYAAVFAYVGSWLPATVYGEGDSFAAARGRGRATFFRAFFRILGALLLTLAVMFAFFIMHRLVSRVLPDTSSFSIAYRTILVFIGALSTTLIAVILSENFLSYEEIDPLANDGNSGKLAPLIDAKIDKPATSDTFGKRG